MLFLFYHVCVEIAIKNAIIAKKLHVVCDIIRIGERRLVVILKLSVENKSGEVAAEFCGNVIDTVLKHSYQEGDRLILNIGNEGFAEVQFDETLAKSVVYLASGSFEFRIPSESETCYHPKAFRGPEHKIFARALDDEESFAYRNIALNACDRPENARVFPHAEANFVTRGDSCFYARNAIDGVCKNTSHGAYPYHSWAGGAREDLEFTVWFGAEAEVDKLVFFLRADFPHDTYWKSADITFSDGSIVKAEFCKTAEGQTVMFDKKKTTFVRFKNFKQISEPLSWAALTQVAVYGKYIKKELDTLEIRNASNSKDVKFYTTDRLREEFLITNLFTKDNIRMVYSHIDRIITAGLMPVFQELKLEAGKELAADFFLQRREMGCINIGGKGIITVDGTEYVMEPRDGIYIGMGNKEVTFKSVNPDEPAKFYMSSCPAHKSYPIVKIDISKAKKVPCGSVEDCNKRVINQYIHPEVMKSCQLSMGLTQLEPGSNWNTMPSHTHDRRMEVYLYLDMDEDNVVFHMMGEPSETRHIVMHNEEAVISPSWSIHSGVGTKAYSFIWAMCGENQEFDDMDHIQTKDLR